MARISNRIRQEAQLFAFAALRALDGAGFDIVPKKDKPDADRP